MLENDGSADVDPRSRLGVERRPAALGGPNWSSREWSIAQDIGVIWAECGQNSEWRRLKAVLLHRPGPEVDRLDGVDPDTVLMRTVPHSAALRDQHDALASALRTLGIAVYLVVPHAEPPPNQMFVADLLFMTPQGAIVGRPAARVRAGEERFVAERLASLGLPILRTVGGHGTFEGADAVWLDPETIVIGVGVRTNREGAQQIAAVVRDFGVRTLIVDMAYGAMHLMGQVRHVDRDLAFVWPGTIPSAVIRALRAREVEIRPFPDIVEAENRFGHNFVVVGPRTIVMADDCPNSARAYRAAGVTCHCVPASEFAKAMGGIACLTGILLRES